MVTLMRTKKTVLLLFIIIALILTLTACGTKENPYVKVSFYVDGVPYQSYWVKKGESLDADISVPDKEGMTGTWSVTNFDALQEDIKVDAIYANVNCTIVFKVDNTTIATLLVKKNSTPASIPVVPEKKGFDGMWNYSDFSNISRDITVTAIYTPKKCTISFMNGDDLYATRIVEYGGTLTNIPDIPTPAYNYTSEWIDESGKKPVFINITQDITIHAYYYITITLTDSYLQNDTINFELEENVITISSGNRTGYDFYGWYYDEELTFQAEFPLKFQQNIMLYARWLKTSDSEDFTFDNGAVINYTGTDTNVVIPYKYQNLEGETVLVNKIGSNAFAMGSIDTISIPGTVIEFADGAFKDCSGLKNLIYPDQNNVQKVGNYAFENCIALERFEGGKYLESIGANAFSNCNLLSILSLGNVVSIGDYAFSGIIAVENVELPESLTTIGKGAFRNATNAVFAYKGLNNIVALGDYAFENCKKLSTFSAPKLQVTGKYVFSGCQSLTHATMVSNTYFYELFGNYTFAGSYIVNINDADYYLPTCLVNLTINANPGGQSTVNGILIENALYNAYYVKNVTMIGNFTSIEKNAFYLSNKNLISELPFSITVSNLVKIDSYAFVGRNDIESISIPAGISEIGDYAFYELENLSTVSIPVNNGLMKVGKYAFGGTAWMINYKGVAKIGKIALGFGTLYISTGNRTALLPSDFTGLNTIAPNAFEGLSSLLEIQIPSSITSIGNNAFSNCVGLKKIEFAATLSATGNNILSGCSYLEEIKIGISADLHKCFGIGIYPNTYTVKRFDLIEGELVENNYYIPSTLNKITLLYDGTQYIKYGKYNNFISLKNVVLGEGVVIINDKAFAGNSSLETLILPSTLEEIGKLENGEEVYSGAFSGCVILNNIIIPVSSNLSKIHDYAFKGTAIKYLQIPSKVEYIGTYAFAETKLESLSFVNGQNNLEIASYAFSGITSFNSSYNIVFPNNLFSIGDYAFYGDISLNYVTLNNELKSIGIYAFGNCNLRNFTIPQSVNFYDEENTCLVKGMLKGNANLILLNLSQGIKMSDLFDENYPLNLSTINIHGGKILDKQFENLSSLQLMSLTNVVEIGSYAFYNCNNLNFTSFTVPSSVESIGSYAFANCTGLTNFLIFSGSKLKTVGEYIFLNNTLLKQVIFPDTITNTSWTGIFDNCSSLTKTNIPESVTHIGDRTFYGCALLEEITIPEYILEIGNYAFYNCQKANFINTNFESLQSIGISAFESCLKIQSFKAENISVIGSNSFAGCPDMAEITILDNPPLSYVSNAEKIHTVNISSKAVNIDSGAFAALTNLTMIYFASEESSILKPMLDKLNSDNASHNLAQNTGIFILSNLYIELLNEIQSYSINVYSYPTIFNNSCFDFDDDTLTATIISGENVSGVLYIPKKVSANGKEYTVTKIGSGAFKNNNAIVSIIIPSSVIIIGQEAFSGCHNLSAITFEAGSALDEIENYAFEFCTSLKQLNLPDNLEKIGIGSFRECALLETIYTTRNSKLAFINEYAFDASDNLKNFYVPKEPVFFENSFSSWQFEGFTITGN